MDNWIDTHGRFLRGELEAYLASGKDYQGLTRHAFELYASDMESEIGRAHV